MMVWIISSTMTHPVWFGVGTLRPRLSRASITFDREPLLLLCAGVEGFEPSLTVLETVVLAIELHTYVVLRLRNTKGHLDFSW